MDFQGTAYYAEICEKCLEWEITCVSSSNVLIEHELHDEYQYSSVVTLMSIATVYIHG